MLLLDLFKYDRIPDGNTLHYKTLPEKCHPRFQFTHRTLADTRTAFMQSEEKPCLSIWLELESNLIQLNSAEKNANRLRK